MLRLFSPIQLCFCLILFFLPWIEVQCVPKPAAAGAKSDPFMPPMPTGPQPLLSQSGLQIATGDYSVSNPQLKAMMDAEGGKGGPKAGPKEDKEGPDAAPLLFLFPVAVLAGIVIGFLPLAGMGRKLMLLACCGVALGVIGVQAGMGFPIKKGFDEDKTKSQKGGGGGNPMIGDDMTVKVVWKVPLYITLFFLVGAAGTAFLGGGKPAPKSGRRRYDEDDRDDDEDDRPRRRARRDD